MLDGILYNQLTLISCEGFGFAYIYYVLCLSTKLDLLVNGFSFWPELLLLLGGFLAVVGSYYVEPEPDPDDDDDDEFSKDKKKQKPRSRWLAGASWLLFVVGLVSIGGGAYLLYNGQPAMVSGFGKTTFDEFWKGWVAHRRSGDHQALLTHFTSFDPSTLAFEQLGRYWRLLPAVLEAARSLSPEAFTTWVNTGGQGQRLVAILDLFISNSSRPGWVGVLELGGNTPDEARQLVDRVFSSLSSWTYDDRWPVFVCRLVKVSPVYKKLTS